MSWSIDPPIWAGAYRVAVLSEKQVATQRFRSVQFFLGEKEPRLIVLSTGTTMSATDLEGRVWDRDAVERRFPGAWSALEARLKAMG